MRRAKKKIAKKKKNKWVKATIDILKISLFLASILLVDKILKL